MSTDPTPDPLAGRLETIRRALAAVAADRPTPEQIAEWNTADKAMAQRIRAALPGVPLHHAYAVLQALRVTRRLDEAAAPDETLRDRVAGAMREHYLCTDRTEADADGNLPCRCGDWREPGVEADDENDWDSHLADAVLSVLPTGGRGAALSAADRQFLTFALDLGADQMASRGDEFEPEDEDAMERLRRLAAGERDEQQAGTEALPASTAPLAAGFPLVKGNCPACRHASLFLGTGGYPTCSNHECTEPDAATTVLEQYGHEAHEPEHTWAAELRDPLAEEWVPGTRYVVRDRAVDALAHARHLAPTWADGTPTDRRLVRATTTYTVETDAAVPVAGQPPADTREEAAWVCKCPAELCGCGHSAGKEA